MIVEIYTDGSVFPNPGKGGWACILKAGEHIKELSGHCENVTNNQMEIEAIHQALKALKPGAKDHKIIVHSDSQWAINACNGNWNIKKNLEKVLSIRKLIADEGWKIEWKWVRGHDGHEYNERCDVLAGKAMRNLSIQSENS